MKTSTLFATLALTTLCVLWTGVARSQDVEAVRPVVVKTVPQSGDKEVAPGWTEIKVTFSKEMTDQSWSWSTAWKDSCPESSEKPRYEADGKTCVLKVKLEPGKSYGYWINSDRFHGFQDKQGRPAVPYLLVFKVKGQ